MTSRPSKSATDAQSVDVSSANNTGAELLHEFGGARSRRRYDDAALGVGDVLELHLEAIVGQQRSGTAGPLDHGDPAGFESLFPPGVRQVDSLEAVQVDVEEGKPSAAVLAHDDECRARDVGRVDAEADRNASREDRLSCPELAGSAEDVVRSRRASESCAEALGVQRGMTDEVDGQHARTIDRRRI